MCGRYQSYLPLEAIVTFFGARATFIEGGQHFNAAPAQMLPVVRFEPKAQERRVDLLRWGLVPHWAKDQAIGNRLINARAESAWRLPAFGSAFASRRCLVPAAGFYEWKKTPNDPKQPYYIEPTNALMFAFAGLWEGWHDPVSQEWLHSFAILTCPSNELLREIHNRMPVILREPSWSAWLGEVQVNQDELKKMILQPYPSPLATVCPVSTRVNNVRNDDAALTTALSSSSTQ
jgi:putative SOS response-associated peptidase YedK